MSRKQAFAALDRYRCVRDSDDSTMEDTVAAFSVLLDELEPLSLDDAVLTMLGALKDDLEMRVQLIASREQEIREEQQHKLNVVLGALQHQVKAIERTIKNSQYVDSQDIREAIAKREAHRAQWGV